MAKASNRIRMGMKFEDQFLFFIMHTLWEKWGTKQSKRFIRLNNKNVLKERGYLRCAGFPLQEAVNGGYWLEFPPC